MKRFTSIGMLLVMLLAFNLAATSQTSKGILAGTARDTTGAVIPDATVTIVGEQTGETRTTATGADGQFRADSLSPEAYTIKVSHQGFAGFEAQHVQVASSAVTSYNVTLSVGKQTDTVTVEADETTVNTESGQLSQTISTSEITTLPVVSLNPFEAAVTIPGVQSVNGANQFSNGQNSQVNGARPRSNNFLMDSQEINDVGIGGQAFQPQIVDMYEDLTVITSTAAAEFGRAGGGIFNLVTKSGSNTFHGTVYDRYSGSGLNSKDAAIRGTGTSKARFDSHTMGFTVGGPIFKDKLFVFGGGQWARVYGRESIAPILVPDTAGRTTLASLTNATAVSQNAVLTNYLINYKYLSTYSLVTTIPTSRINIGAQAGCATNPCFVEEAYFQRPFPSESNPDTQWSYRVDFKPSANDTIYVRYLHDRSSFSPDFFANAAGGALGLDTYQGGPSELGAGSWTHVFTSHVVNELRAGETRISFLFAPLPSTLATPAYALPTLNIAGFPSLGAGQNFPQGRSEDLYQLQDSFTYTHGSQSLRFGFDVGRQLEKDVVALNAKGTATLANASGAGSALANFLSDQLGSSGTITKTTGPLRVDPHGWRSGFFAQDDIKMTPNFTVNIGVRYDYTTDPENSLPYPAIDQYNPYQSITTVLKVNNDYNNISPRIGFAYSPNFGGFFGSGKTSIRAGFGIFYDSYFSNFVINAAQSAPNAVGGTLQQTSATGPISIASNLNSFTPTLTGTASVQSVDKTLRNPQTYQYNLGIEQELTKGVVLGIRYVGDRGEKLFANEQYNYRVGTTGLRLNTTRGVINSRGNYADSNYNSIQADITARVGRTLAIRGNYVFSKDLDDGSEIFITGDVQTSYTANLAPGGRRQDYGPSAFDHRHFFSVSYSWMPRGFRSDNRGADILLNILTRNFTVGGVSQLQSGPYGTVNSSGVDQNGDGSAANDRPIIGNASAPFQTAGIDGAFVGLKSGTYYDVGELNTIGNGLIVTPNQVHFLVPYDPTNKYLSQVVSRNFYLNPGSTTHNLALQKGFSPEIKHFERGQFVIRAEATNVFNHNDRSYQDTDVLDFGPAALVPTSLNTDNLARVDSQRTLVLWGKFIF
ncbi:MAG TPA: carboxypeptidase regulatory-like domain-containing protein [Acidobacteriaceae bacterium]